MKILIVYGTRKGWTQKSAEVIYDILKNSYLHDVEIYDYKATKNVNIDFSKYDVTIIGSSIMAGFWKFGVRRFIRKNRDKLKGLALFVSAGATLEDANKGKMTKNEAINKAKAKYIEPIKRKYKLRTITEGVFGGQYDNRGKVLFNSWNKEDVEQWAISIEEYFNDRN